MKNFSKKAFALLCSIMMMFAFSFNTFAANKYYNKGYQYSGKVFWHTVQFSKWGTDKVTIVNTGKTPLYVDCYRGNGTTTIGGKQVTKATIYGNSERTFAYKNNGPYSISIQATGTGSTSYRIKTTSGSIN